MKDITEEFYKAWMFIQDHPKFIDWSFATLPTNLEIIVTKVNPETKSIDDDESKNTLVQVWLEYGPAEKDEKGLARFTYDPELDTGADTFELAIIKLAKLVKKKYGTYKPED